MTINNHKLNVTIAVYDGCHKIFIPVEGQEDLFISHMENNKGWVFEEDFYKISGVKDLMDMYLNSCSLRFIQQIDCGGATAASGNTENFIDIIPQFEFTDDEGYFDEDAAKKAFAA